MGATRNSDDKLFYYDAKNRKNKVDPASGIESNEDANANCLTIGEKESSNGADSPEFIFRASKCDEDMAKVICMLDVTEVDDDTGNEETSTQSNIPGANLPKFPCISQDSRRKRLAIAEEGTPTEPPIENADDTLQKEYLFDGRLSI